ncbi:MAG: sigma-70 family RNA polymerase sigma factor [Phycisphaeraceae bacterium]|nr:sigma-70 family RNA polymerase sigma factor [Phycisphaeraceae bacterium]
MIEAYIRSLVPDAHDRDDVLQETAKQVAVMFDQYDPERPFANWAVGIARLRVLECRNRRRREGKMFGGDMLNTVATAILEVQPEMSQRIAAMEQCVKKLKPRHRTLLDLRHTDDLDVTTIAERVGVKPNTISVALYKIRTKLAECIKRRVEAEDRGGGAS